MVRDDNAFYRAQIINIIVFFVAATILQITDSIMKDPEGSVITKQFINDLCVAKGLDIIKFGCLVALAISAIALFVYNLGKDSDHEEDTKKIGRIISWITIPVFLFIATGGLPLIFGNPQIENVTAVQVKTIPKSERDGGSDYTLLLSDGRTVRGALLDNRLVKEGDEFYLVLCNDDIQFIFSADEYSVASDTSMTVCAPEPTEPSVETFTDGREIIPLDPDEYTEDAVMSSWEAEAATAAD
ncbi:MAG: hypothetical protein K6F49_08945 [Saccharofermentans sp.]|nr:hypothetical protein [Saccharofermentans sp.]